MIKIYFDNVLIDEDKYSSLSNDFELFDTSFRLGTTASNKFKISIGKEAITTQPTEIKIYDNSTLIATLVVDNIEEDDYAYTYTLTDKMVNLEFYYDASLIFVNGHATLLDIALDICTKAGIVLATTNFRGYDKDISWYDNTRTAREYIGYIAELNGGYAQIGTDGRLYFLKQKTNSVKTISIDDCQDFKIGERKEITRVVYELGTLKYEYGDETGNTLYLNSDNVFITEESEVQAIYNEIQGFVFCNFTTSNCPIDFNVRAGQIITFTDGTNNYPTIAGYEIAFYGDWYGGYLLDINSSKQEETKIVGTDDKIKNLSIIVNRDKNLIEQVVVEVDEQNSKINRITQTVDELNSKISDIADITTSQESIYASVSFEDINQSEPIRVEIRPLGTNISYLYPRANLYPSNDLFMTDRKIRFVNTSTYIETEDTVYLSDKDYFSLSGSTYTLLVAGTDYTIGNSISGTIYQHEIFDYTLPTDLLYYDADNYDEFILDYDSQTCVVNKRVGYNADGTTYVLSNPQTLEFTYPTIELTDGDYTVSLLGYSNAYLFVRLMAQNIYTTQFATRAEVHSEISQTATDINLSVDSKLSNYSTTTQMNTAITLTANSILNSVSATYATLDTTNTISATLELKLNTADLISEINASADIIRLHAGRLIIDSGNCQLDGYGNLSATNANISGTITATSGIFDNCTIRNTCSVPASTVTGTLASSNIPNLNASKITSGTLTGVNIHGCTITGGSLEYSSATITDTLTIGQGRFSTGTVRVGAGTGQTTSVSIGGRTLNFTCGILTSVS